MVKATSPYLNRPLRTLEQARRDIIRRKNTFIHITPKDNSCKHDFQGWRDFEDGSGGERVCTKCKIGAMTYTLMMGI